MPLLIKCSSPFAVRGLLVHCTMLCVRFEARACFAVTCVVRMHGLV